MSPLRLRGARLAWAWCVAYTAVVPAPSRLRRREEIRSHLWESEQERVTSGQIVSAVVRGVLDDLGWAARGNVRAIATALRGPYAYVAIAAAGPIVPVGISTFSGHRLSGIAERTGALVGVAGLSVAAAVWLISRRTR